MFGFLSVPWPEPNHEKKFLLALAFFSLHFKKSNGCVTAVYGFNTAPLIRLTLFVIGLAVLIFLTMRFLIVKGCRTLRVRLYAGRQVLLKLSRRLRAILRLLSLIFFRIP